MLPESARTEVQYAAAITDFILRAKAVAKVLELEVKIDDYGTEANAKFTRPGMPGAFDVYLSPDLVVLPDGFEDDEGHETIEGEDACAPAPWKAGVCEELLVTEMDPDNRAHLQYAARVFHGEIVHPSRLP